MPTSKKIIGSVYPFPFFIGGGHNTNFTLIKGNEIFTSEEGKINEVVNSSCDRFPEKSILAGLKHFDIHPQEVDHWIFGSPGQIPTKPALKFFLSKFKTKSYEELSRNKCISFTRHHLAHAGLAIYGSGFDNGIFVSMDDGGDGADPFDTVWGTFENNSIKTLGNYNKGGWGIARFHNFICEATGYLGNVDNGKVMGLAAYGKVEEDLYKKLKKFLVVSEDGFSAKFLLRHNPQRSKPRYEKLKLDSYEFYKVINTSNPPAELKEITKYYSSINIAATGQRIVEDVALEIISNMLNFTKKKKIVCSGGFFQNISFNKRLLDLGLQGVYVPSAPNDSGLSLGAALLYKMSVEKKRPRKTLSSYLGPQFKNEEIKDILDEFNLDYKKSKNICRETANFLKKGKIVGWFQGRSELGPRSLGARSVLGDPRKFINKAKINQLLKKRDWFMPYAPSVLYDKMDFFYDKKINCPYMSFSMKITKNSSRIPAAVHVDGSSRPHTIKKNDFPRYYNLIKEFYRFTGVPAILNTSFNRHGIATIQTPRQAIEHLLNGCVEILVIEDFIVFAHKKNRKKIERLYSEGYYLLVEKIRHIIEAMVSNDRDLSKIIKENKKILESNNIIFNTKTKELILNRKKLKFNNFNRDEIRKKIFPLLDKKNFSIK